MRPFFSILLSLKQKYTFFIFWAVFSWIFCRKCVSAICHFDFFGLKFRLSFLYLFFFFYKSFCSKIMLLNSPTSFTCLPVTHDFRLRVKESNCAVHNFLLKKSIRQESTNDIKFCIENLKIKAVRIETSNYWVIPLDRPFQVNVIYYLTYLESFISLLASLYYGFRLLYTCD